MDYQNFQDLELTCADCGQTFLFSADDQEFFAQKGYSNPKRCRTCRTNRKMNSGGGRGFNKPQFNVICSACGCETTVPFEPRGDRPVYCSDCYKNNR